MKAVKGNKEYTIDESQKKYYQDSGFDIVDEDGQVISYGRGKTVPYDDYVMAAKEIERLQALVSRSDAENEALKAEIDTLRTARQEPAKKADSKKAGE